MPIREYNPVNLTFAADKIKDLVVGNFNAISASIATIIPIVRSSNVKIREIEKQLDDLNSSGSIDITQITEGTGSAETFDALRFFDSNGQPITSALSGLFFITMQDGADVKSIQYRYLNVGQGVTSDVFNIADQAQTVTPPWTSSAVVADGSGVKLQLLTSAGRTNVRTVARFIGCRIPS